MTVNQVNTINTREAIAAFISWPDEIQAKCIAVRNAMQVTDEGEAPGSRNSVQQTLPLTGHRGGKNVPTERANTAWTEAQTELLKKMIDDHGGWDPAKSEEWGKVLGRSKGAIQVHYHKHLKPKDN